MKRIPIAYCLLKGNKQYKDLKGLVLIYDDNLIKITISKFPVNNLKCSQSIIAIHIHEGKECNSQNSFESALGHYNPNKCEHPYHAGDLGNLFVNKDGTVLMMMKYDRFDINDIIGRTIILHSKFDDFKTQPSGDSGERIACGIIKRLYKVTD